MTLSPKVQKRISLARERLLDAEKELSKLLEALDVNERADKKMIGELLRAALDKVVAAKTNLADLLLDSGS